MLRGMKAANDDEPTWTTLAAATGSALAKELLFENEPKDPDRSSERADEERERSQREYVESRLRELRAFERRAGGKKN